MSLSLQEFSSSVIPQIRKAWPGKGFERNWNEFNQRIAFKLLSAFNLHDVLQGIEDFRFDNPDSREPEFKAIAARLWAKRKATAATMKSEDTDYRSKARSWARNKSDEDVWHWSEVGINLAMVSAPLLWRIIQAAELRSPIRLIVGWAAEMEINLSFKSGSDEWLELYGEYDLQERRRENDRIGDWMGRKAALEAKSAKPPTNKLFAPQSVLGNDSVPF